MATILSKLGQTYIMKHPWQLGLSFKADSVEKTIKMARTRQTPNNELVEEFLRKGMTTAMRAKFKKRLDWDDKKIDTWVAKQEDKFHAHQGKGARKKFVKKPLSRAGRGRAGGARGGGPAPGGQQQPRRHRFRPGTVALQEIRRYQHSREKSGIKLLIPRRRFRMLCREIAQDIKIDLRFSETSFIALQESAECYIVGLMDDAMLCATHAHRVTMMSQDILLAYRIRGDRFRYGLLVKDKSVSFFPKWAAATTTTTKGPFQDRPHIPKGVCLEKLKSSSIFPNNNKL